MDGVFPEALAVQVGSILMITEEFLGKKVALFRGLPVERIEAVVSDSRQVSLERNEAIAHQGSEATHLCFIFGIQNRS